MWLRNDEGSDPAYAFAGERREQGGCSAAGGTPPLGKEEAEQNDFDQSVSLQKVRNIAERIRERPDRQFNFSRAAARAGLSTGHFRAFPLESP